MSALHVATSHFYHDSYFRRFRSVYNLTLLLVTFCLWFVVVEVATSCIEELLVYHEESIALIVTRFVHLRGIYLRKPKESYH